MVSTHPIHRWIKPGQPRLACFRPQARRATSHARHAQHEHNFGCLLNATRFHRLLAHNLMFGTCGWHHPLLFCFAPRSAHFSCSLLSNWLLHASCVHPGRARGPWPIHKDNWFKGAQFRRLWGASEHSARLWRPAGNVEGRPDTSLSSAAACHGRLANRSTVARMAPSHRRFGQEAVAAPKNGSRARPLRAHIPACVSSHHMHKEPTDLTPLLPLGKACCVPNPTPWEPLMYAPPLYQQGRHRQSCHE